MMVIGYWLLVIGKRLRRKLFDVRRLTLDICVLGEMVNEFSISLPTLSPSHLLTYKDKSVAKQRKPQFLISNFYFLINPRYSVKNSSFLIPHSSFGFEGGH